MHPPLLKFTLQIEVVGEKNIMTLKCDQLYIWSQAFFLDAYRHIKNKVSFPFLWVICVFLNFGLSTRGMEFENYGQCTFLDRELWCCSWDLFSQLRCHSSKNSHCQWDHLAFIFNTLSSSSLVFFQLLRFLFLMLLSLGTTTSITFMESPISTW